MSSSLLPPTRGANVGRVVVDVMVRNLDDVRRAERGELAADHVRSIVVRALVDTGATFFCLPDEQIQALGLPFNRNRPTRTVAGEISMPVYGGARISVEGRECDVEVMGLPSGRQTLLGQIPLETLDYWVDVTNQRLVGNPEHGGEWMAEAY